MKCVILFLLCLSLTFAATDYASDNRFSTSGQQIFVSDYDFVFNTIYLWDGSSWSPRTCSGEALGQSWVSSCSYDFASESLGSGTYYVAAFACDRSGSTYLCNDNKWLLKEFDVAAGNHYVELEAESALLTNMQSTTFIQPLSPNSGSAAFSFTIPDAAVYHIWARVSADAGAPTGSNSYFVTLDDEVQDIYDFAYDSSSVPTSFIWEKVTLRCGGAHDNHLCDPFAPTLSAGSHTLLFEGREALAKLDKIIITNDKDFVPTEPIDPVCGNGKVENGEACDDSNTANGDGCSSVCQLEPKAACDDGEDNDGDGLVDLADPGCSSTSDNSEFNSVGGSPGTFERNAQGDIVIVSDGKEYVFEGEKSNEVITSGFTVTASNTIENQIFYNLFLDGYGGLGPGNCLMRAEYMDDSDPTKEICERNQNKDLFRLWARDNEKGSKNVLIKNVDIRNAFRPYNYVDGTVVKEFRNIPHTDTFQNYHGKPERHDREWLVIQDSEFKNSDNNLMIIGSTDWKGIVFHNLRSGYCDDWFKDDAQTRNENDARLAVGKSTPDKRYFCTNSMTARTYTETPLWLIDADPAGGVTVGTQGAPVIVVGKDDFFFRQVSNSDSPICKYDYIEDALADTNAGDGCGNFERPPFIELSCAGWKNPPAGCSDSRGYLG